MNANLDLPEVETRTADEPIVLSAPVRAKPTAPSRRSKRGIMIAGAAFLACAAIGSYYYWCVAPYESTDDAYVEADVTPIAPQVAGRVLRVLVSDNQEVSPGAELFEIDPRDFQTRLDAAHAELAAGRGRAAQAAAQLTVDEAKVDQEHANVAAAEAESDRATADYHRYSDAGKLAVSASQLDLAATQAKSSDAETSVALNRLAATRAQLALDQADIETAQAGILHSEAAVRQAELDLSYTRVVAPVAGFVTHRGVQPGDYVQTGQPQLALVPRQTWIIANFKETQLAHMRPGQRVEISVDAYPQLKVLGHIDSIQAGAGARFSLFPPENSSGNFVKVVQRVPVKIALDDESRAQILGPGMSVIPEVRVR